MTVLTNKGVSEKSKKHQHGFNFILKEENINNGMKCWIQVMCDNQQKEKDFYDLYCESSKIIGSAVYKFRKKMIDSGEGQHINGSMLESKETCKYYDDLKNLLEKLFQEYIEDIEIYLKCIRKNNWTWDRIIEEHDKDKCKRLWRIVSCRCRE